MGEYWTFKKDWLSTATCYINRTMKTFEESGKSKKTVSSMIEHRKDEPAKKPAKGKENKPVKSMDTKLMFYFLLSCYNKI